MGFTELMMAFVDCPELVRGLVDLSIDVNIEMAKEVAARGRRPSEPPCAAVPQSDALPGVPHTG